MRMYYKEYIKTTTEEFAAFMCDPEVIMLNTIYLLYLGIKLITIPNNNFISLFL